MGIKILNRYNGRLIREVDAPSLRGADFTEADLMGAYLTGADLRDANLIRADLRGADLTEADLEGANLGGANLREADLRGATLRDADLRGAYLRGANLRGAYLRGANLKEANLDRADLRGADLMGDDLGDLKIPTIKNIHQKVYEVTKNSETFDINFCHSECGTIHCRAGWVVELAGEMGKVLEGQISCPTAANLIYAKSSEIKIERSFHTSSELALRDIKRCAGEEGVLG